MLLFQIKLQCISDFEKYVTLFETFPIQGKIRGNRYETQADDITGILEHYQTGALSLCLTDYDNKDMPAISKYLRGCGLLAADGPI